MRDTWIDEHTGEETIPRSGFRADLRSALAAEFEMPAKRNTPWKAIGWASVAAAAAIATVVVATSNDGGRTVTPATDPTTEETTPETLVPFSLRDRLIDVVWVVQTRNAEDLAGEFGGNLPSFTLQNVGRLVGFDGCNQYGFDTSDPGGWTLDGDVIRFDQELVSTAMACTDVPEPIIPVVDGTTVEFAPETGVLTLFHRDGTIYTARGSDVEPPLRDDLVVTADGGTPLTPRVIGTVTLPTAEPGALVALLPDRIVVLPRGPLTLEGSVVSFDHDGKPLADTSFVAVPDADAAIALGGYDGTLYVITFPALGDTQTAHAYELVGDVWRELDSEVVEQNNDGVYAVTGEGLVIGDTVVLAAQSPDASIPETGWTFADGGMQVFRNDTDGSTKLWDITEEFENFNIPPVIHPFGDGVLYFGNPGLRDPNRYIAVLSATEGESEYFRPGDWRLAGVDGDTALFVRVTDGVVTLGVLQAD